MLTTQRLRLRVDVNHGRPGLQRNFRHLRSWIDHAGGANREQQITISRRRKGRFERIDRQALAKPDHAGPDQTAALLATWRRKTPTFGRF